MPAWMDDDLEERRRRGLYRVRRRLQSGQGVRVRLRGRELLSFSSNDYLALAGDIRLARAAARAAHRYGCGAGASALVSGYLPPLRSLERTLADWEETEAALVFSSGYAANLAAVGSLAGKQDTVFSDAFNHASLIDGCRLSRAAVHVYRHADLDQLHRLLQAERGRARRAVIVSDSVFSMDGDLAPLPALCDLAERWGCMLMVDEAHATGVLGARGAGAVDALGVRGRVPIVMGTLSKALGSVGGFVAGSRRLVDFLRNRARTFMFDTALAPSAVGAAIAALRVARVEEERRARLRQMIALLHDELVDLGYEVLPPDAAILPVLVGDSDAALDLAVALRERGVWAPAIRPPAVPRGTARVRVTLMATHTPAQLERAVSAFAGARRALHWRAGR